MNHLEQQILDIKLNLDRIAEAKGKKKEIAVRRVYGDHVDVAEALKLLLDPAAVFHIGAKSFGFLLPQESIKEPLFEDFYDLCAWLQTKKALTDADIARVQWTLQTVKPYDFRLYAQDFLCKKVTLGVTAKTVNKALGFEFIPEFRCMLANKYFEHPDKVEGKHFYLTEKLDGIRCLAVVKDGSVQLFSRQGQPIEGLIAIEADLCHLREQIGKDFVFDGELLVSDRDGIPSKEQYKQTTMIVRREGTKLGITYNVFDVLDVEAFETRCCDTPYYLRRQKLDAYCAALSNTVSIISLPVLYHGTDTSEIMKHLNIQRGLEHEGVMINLADEPYQFTRTNALLKVKVMQDCDLEITGVQEGTGKFAGTLGALIVDYKGNPVGVGSGLTDEMRKQIWADPDQYIGRVATIQYFEATNDKDGKESIRFPVFKELRENGKEVSYS